MGVTPTTRLNDAISGDRAEQLATDLGHQKSRLAIQSVLEEYIHSDNFVKKVKTVQLDALEGDSARNKLVGWAKGLISAELTSDVFKTRQQKQVDDRIVLQLEARGWKKKAIYWPVAIGCATLVVGVAMMVIGFMTLQAAQEANRINVQNAEKNNAEINR